MFFAEDLTWNVRDTHMTDTATHLNEYLSTQRKIQRPKIAICASPGLHLSTVWLCIHGRHGGCCRVPEGLGFWLEAPTAKPSCFSCCLNCCLSFARHLVARRCTPHAAARADQGAVAPRQGRTTATWVMRATRAWGDAGARSTLASCCERSEWLYRDRV